MKYLQIYPCEVLGKNTGQFLFPNRSNTTATDGSTFVFRSGRSLVWRFTKYGGDLDSNRKTQGRYSSHWHRFAAFSRNRCFPLFSLGGVLFSSHPPQLIFFSSRFWWHPEQYLSKSVTAYTIVFARSQPTDKYLILFRVFG